MRIPAVFLTVSVVVGIFWQAQTPVLALTDAECASRLGIPGARVAKPTDDAVKNGHVEAGSCYDPTNPSLGVQAEAAKQFLLTRQDCVRGQGITGEDPKNCILKLDANFAILLAKLFKEDPHFQNANIHSGYRSDEGEYRVSGKRTGNHRRGCAVDLTGGTWNKGTCGAACQYAVQNSATLKVKLPYYPGTPGEENHLEPTQACSGSPASGPQTGVVPPSASPFRGGPPNLGNLFSQPNAMSGPTNFPQQNLPSTQNPYSYIQPPTPVAITPPGASTYITTPTSSPSGPTAIEQIARIANPTSTPASVTIGTSTPVTLNTDIKNSATLQGTLAVNAASGTSNYQGGPVASQTFVSDDMRNLPPVTGKILGSTELFRLLETIKQTILTILNFLRPFGSRPQAQTEQIQETFYEIGH